MLIQRLLPPALLLGCWLLAAAPASVHAQKPGWTNDQAKAMQAARDGKKLLLMDFTGSDWCGWCMKLDQEVFSTPEFRAYAQKNLVLMELDFPRQKFLPLQVKQQNTVLARQYGIQGYPTVVVLNAEGKKSRRTRLRGRRPEKVHCRPGSVAEELREGWRRSKPGYFEMLLIASGVWERGQILGTRTDFSNAVHLRLV